MIKRYDYKFLDQVCEMYFLWLYLYSRDLNAQLGGKIRTLIKVVFCTVKSLFVAAATIGFDEIFAQNLLSKNCFLLRPLFKGGYYLRAATNKDFTVYRLKDRTEKGALQNLHDS